MVGAKNVYIEEICDEIIVRKKEKDMILCIKWQKLGGRTTIGIFWIKDNEGNLVTHIIEPLG